MEFFSAISHNPYWNIRTWSPILSQKSHFKAIVTDTAPKIESITNHLTNYTLITIVVTKKYREFSTKTGQVLFLTLSDTTSEREQLFLRSCRSAHPANWGGKRHHPSAVIRLPPRENSTAHGTRFRNHDRKQQTLQGSSHRSCRPRNRQTQEFIFILGMDDLLGIWMSIFTNNLTSPPQTSTFSQLWVPLQRKRTKTINFAVKDEISFRSQRESSIFVFIWS